MHRGVRLCGRAAAVLGRRRPTAVHIRGQRCSSSSGSGSGGGSDAAAVTVVKNTGSVARDHLANERTFLAWARTGMAFVALGVGINSVHTALDAGGWQQSSRDCIRNTGSTNTSTSSDTGGTNASTSSDTGGSTTITSSDAVTSSQGKNAKSDVMTLMLSPFVPSALCVAAGGVLLAYATQRFYSVQRHLQNGNFPLNRSGVGAVVVGTACLTSASIVLLFASGQPRFKRWIAQQEEARPSADNRRTSG